MAISIYIQAQKEDNPNMDMPPGLGRLTTAQEIIQTLFLIIVTFVGTWLALYRVPWQVSADPCIIAAVASVGVVTCLWLTRWRGLRAVISERNVLAGFLMAMPLVYLARYLFASTGRGANYWLAVEVLGTIIFVALALLGVKHSPWFLAIGMSLHGLAWDAWHYRNSAYIPDWYVIACLAIDLSLGSYVVARVPIYQRASRSETEN